MNPFTEVERAILSIDRSSLIKEIQWNRNGHGNDSDPKGELILTFANNEKYEYVGVPSSTLYKMLTSKSMGKFFHSNIMDQYTTYKEI